MVQRHKLVHTCVSLMGGVPTLPSHSWWSASHQWGGTTSVTAAALIMRTLTSHTDRHCPLESDEHWGTTNYVHTAASVRPHWLTVFMTTVRSSCFERFMNQVPKQWTSSLEALAGRWRWCRLRGSWAMSRSSGSWTTRSMTINGIQNICTYDTRD